MKNPCDMTRWEALDAVGEASILASEGKWGSLALLLGVTDDIAEELTMDDLVDVMRVRMSDLAVQAGVIL